MAETNYNEEHEDEPWDFGRWFERIGLQRIAARQEVLGGNAEVAPRTTWLRDAMAAMAKKLAENRPSGSA